MSLVFDRPCVSARSKVLYFSIKWDNRDDTAASRKYIVNDSGARDKRLELNERWARSAKRKVQFQAIKAK